VKPRVVLVDPLADPRWDALVETHPGAGAYHQSAWARVLRRAHGVKPRYLGLEDRDGKLNGGLPLMSSRGLVSGRRLRALPVVPPADPIAPTQEGRTALVGAACELAHAEGAGALMLRTRQEGYDRELEGLASIPQPPAWIVPLPDDPEQLRADWRKGSKMLFRNIRKAERAGLVVREARGETDLRRFYALYLEAMRRHRSLPRPYSQIKLSHALLGPSGRSKVYLVDHDGRTHAAGLFHRFGNTLDLLYNGSDAQGFALRANNALYWHAIQWAIEAGVRRFDFGTAWPGSSLARFKAQWSTEQVPEYRYDYRRDQTAQRLESIRSASHQLGEDEHPLGALWDRTPIALTRVAGALAYRLF
jgi:hypothetical protein